MAYNFKSIADVEVVAEPTESANVLIEEDGIIKKASKNVFCGSGSDTYYIFIKDGSAGGGIVTASDGIYEAILERLFGNVPTGIAVRVFILESGQNIIEELTVTSYIYEPGDECVRVNASNGILFYINKDGNHGYYWD